MMREHAAEVDRRGERAMGFSHNKTTHHFRLMSDGGAIEVTADGPADATSEGEIRAHLSHIAQMFSAGNFSIPMLVHARKPPGTPAMRRLKAKIRYTYEEIPAGGRVRIATDDRQALAAVHQFLRFQIEDHRTGDSATEHRE